MVKPKVDQMANKYFHLKLVFIMSLFAFPVTYMFDFCFKQLDHSSQNSSTLTLIMMSVGVSIFILVPLATIKLSQVHDWLYYGVTLFTFTAVIDLIITLEFNGFISGFMSVYLDFGEPYLQSPYGSAIAFFDAIGLYIMYLLMVYQISNGISWRSTGIYWSASILNSMIVLLLGAFTGKHSPTFCTLLNIPYVLMPIFAGVRAIKSEKRGNWTQVLKRKSGLLTIIDALLVIGILISLWIIFAKGLRALGSDAYIIVETMKAEPSILHNFDDPAKFPSIQSLLYLFYYTPILVIQLIYIFSNSKPQYLWELSLILSGGLLQGQFSMIGQSIDPQTPLEFKSDWKNMQFWIVNLFLIIIPHIYLLRLVPHKGLNENTTGGKKLKQKKHE